MPWESAVWISSVEMHTSTRCLLAPWNRELFLLLHVSFSVYTAPGGFPGKIRLSCFLCHRYHFIRYWIQTLVTLVIFRHHSEDCRSAVHRRSIALLRSSETFFFNPLNPKGAQWLISPRIDNPESFIKIAYRQRQPWKLWFLFKENVQWLEGERGGWGGVGCTKKGTNMDFQIKRLNECCLGPRCQLPCPWEVEFTRRFLRSCCFCLTSSKKGSVFVISFLHFGISHFDLNYADCADLTWLPASQHPPPPSPPPEPLYPLVWTRNNQSVVKIRYAIQCTCLFKVGVTPVKFRWRLVYSILRNISALILYNYYHYYLTQKSRYLLRD